MIINRYQLTTNYKARLSIGVRKAPKVPIISDGMIATYLLGKSKAAEYVLNLTLDGYNDWYIPSWDELQFILDSGIREFYKGSLVYGTWKNVTSSTEEEEFGYLKSDVSTNKYYTYSLIIPIRKGEF